MNKMNDTINAFITISGWIVGFISLVIAVASLIFAYKEKQNNSKAQDRFFNKLGSVPLELLGLLGVNNRGGVKHLYDFQENLNSPFSITQMDIDNDGEEEILVQSGYGSYSCKLEIYNFIKNDDDPTLSLIDSVIVSTMSGYVFNDIDGDGKIEIVTVDNSIKADKAYVFGFRDSVVFIFEDKKIKEISREELYTDEELKERYIDP